MSSNRVKLLACIVFGIVLLLPIHFFYVAKELRSFKKTVWSYRRFLQATYTNPDSVSITLPSQLRHVPFGEKKGPVVKVRTVDIRGDIYPYNASIIQKDGSGYLLFFRYDLADERSISGICSYIGYAELDSNFQQTEKEFRSIKTNSHYSEDARVLQAKDTLFLVYNDRIKNHFGNNRIMCMGELDLAHAKLKNITTFDLRLQSIEKNWVPFTYTDPNGESGIYFGYSAVPLKVLKVSDQNIHSVIPLPSPYNGHLQSVYWPATWGTIRGGTEAQKVDGQYLTFFHSAFRDKNNIFWYCLGAYTFEAEPPFRITGISNYPILFDGIYDTPIINTADPSKRVIFPCGFVIEKTEAGELIHLSCGENDSGIKIITLEKQALLKGLKKIRLKKNPQSQ